MRPGTSDHPNVQRANHRNRASSQRDEPRDGKSKEEAPTRISREELVLYDLMKDLTPREKKKKKKEQFQEQTASQSQQQEWETYGQYGASSSTQEQSQSMDTQRQQWNNQLGMVSRQGSEEQLGGWEIQQFSSDDPEKKDLIDSIADIIADYHDTAVNTEKAGMVHKISFFLQQFSPLLCP